MLLLDALALLLFGCSFGTGLLLPLSAQLCAVVSLVPLPERCSIDLDDGGFGQGVCADEFVVGCALLEICPSFIRAKLCHTWMVDDTDDAGLASDGLRAP
jgi:hypothetical protein